MARKPSLKSERVASIIKRCVSELLTTELNDPKLGFVTVTDVEVSNDLSFAKVFVTFLGKQERNEAGLRTLDKAKGRIRNYVSKHLDTRKCPELTFLLDESLETGNRIESIINELNKKEDREN